MAVRITFETHATTLDNERGVATGWLPGELSGAGRAQARQLGERLAGRDVDALISSDLTRARQTVRLAVEAGPSRGGGLPVLFDWRLRECDYGDLNGAPRALTIGRAERYLTDPHPAGESWEQALDRVDEALRDIIRRWDTRRVLVIGHVATRWALQRMATGQSLSQLAAEDFAWQPGWDYELG
ncbi:histidine phosphatase family protein [soil metagenome]|jgi:broad specificity phosphatase PhoE